MHTEQKWLPLLSRAAACGLTGVVLTLMLSWLAAFAVNRELLPEVDTQLIALICCAIACLITGAFSPQPEKGRALGGAMTSMVIPVMWLTRPLSGRWLRRTQNTSVNARHSGAVKSPPGRVRPGACHRVR